MAHIVVRASMRIGDLDGLEVIYDKLGRPILADGEVQVGEHSAEAFALYQGRRARGEPLIHHGQGDVLVVLTDGRMLALVDPSLARARRVLHLPGEESWTKGMELFAVIQGRGRYYLEVPWGEVPQVRVGARGSDPVEIALRPDEAEEHLLVVDRETAAWVERGWKAHAGLLG